MIQRTAASLLKARLITIARVNRLEFSTTYWELRLPYYP
jgi:hypothetical protein